MSELRPIKVAWATDQGYILPCAVSIHSALRHSSGPIEVHLLCFDLDDEGRRLIRETVQTNPRATLILHELSMDRLSNLDLSHHPYMTPATFGRQFLPELIAGSVVYIDADTLVTDDLRPLAESDLKGAPIGAVRDFGTIEKLQWTSHPRPGRSRKTLRWVERERRQLDNLRTRIGQEDVSQYFNAGILVVDCDHIRANPELQTAFENIEGASKYAYLDQDWLNRVLHGQVTWLDPRWNAYWGNFKSRFHPFSKEAKAQFAESRRSPGIVHYPGRHKPWNAFRLSQVHRSIKWFALWRLEARQWRKALEAGKTGR